MFFHNTIEIIRIYTMPLAGGGAGNLKDQPQNSQHFGNFKIKFSSDEAYFFIYLF